MRPLVVVVSHTHWDREWYQPFEVFRLRLADLVEGLLDLLDRDPGFRHFMLDGQTVCLDDVVALRPQLAARLAAHVAAGRIGVGPWYVLQDEHLVGAEASGRNLAEGLRTAARVGAPLRVGYLPDAFGHAAQMPRILRGFGIDTAVVWRGVGDRAPGTEWRWRAPSGAEVLCLFLPGGYGNAHGLGADAQPPARLARDLAEVLPRSAAGVILWMNGNDHQPPEPGVPAVLAALAAARPEVELVHGSLAEAAARVRDRVDVDALPVVEGELLRPTPTVPVLSGVWSARSWQKRAHDEAQALLARVVEPFLARAGVDRRQDVGHAWRLLLRCQPHDSICGCSVDEVHRDVDARLRRLHAVGRALVAEAVFALVGARTGDFALHRAIAVANPHPFAVDAPVEIEVQRPAGAPFRLRGPAGEVAYDVVSRWPTDGPDGRAAEWLRLRLSCEGLPPHGLRVVAIEDGAPAPPAPLPTSLAVHPVAGGIEIVDTVTHLRVLHTVEDEPDRGDLYDFCPVEGAAVRDSRHAHLGLHVVARPVGRRLEIDLELDHQATDHRLRLRFAPSSAPAALVTDTAFGWLPRAAPGRHPVSSVALLVGATPVALGGPGLHEVEAGADGATRLTLLRAIGWMSRGDLSTRPGHAGYNVPTPDGQGPGRLRYRYTVAFGEDAVRQVEVGGLPPSAVALADGAPEDRPFLALEPATVRLSIWKRADDGRGWVLRLLGPPAEAVTARVRFFGRAAAAFASDLDERRGAPLALDGELLAVEIPADEVVTVRIDERR